MVTSLLIRLALLVVFAVGVTGCQLGIGIEVNVGRDGSGTLSVALTADKELLAHAEEAGIDPLAALVAQGRQLAVAGWEVREQPTADGGRKVRLSARYDNPDEFETLATDLAEALAAPEVRLLEPFTLTVSTDEIRVTGGAGLEPTSAIAELGVQPVEAVRLAIQENVITYEVRVRLPGEVLATNAPIRQDGTLVWTIRPGGRAVIRAVGTRPPLPPLPVILAAGIAVLLGGVAAVVALRRRRRAPDQTEA